MINGRSKILEWFDNIADCPYISIYRKGKIESGNFVFSNKDAVDQTKQDGRFFLEKCLGILASGDYEIVAAKQNSSMTGKGRYEETFSISQNEAGNNNANNQPQITGIQYTQEDIKRMAQEQFENLMAQQKAKDLEAKVKDLEKENKELNAQIKKPWQEVISGLAPHFPGILQGLGVIPAAAAMPAVNGLVDNKIKEPVTETQATDEAGKIIEAFVTALANQYPDSWIVILQKLTNTVTKEPGKIDMALKFL